MCRWLAVSLEAKLKYCIYVCSKRDIYIYIYIHTHTSVKINVNLKL